MIVNGPKLVRLAPVSPMPTSKQREHGVSWGLTEAGIDVRIRQTVEFIPPNVVALWGAFQRDDAVAAERAMHGYVLVDGEMTLGRSALASTVETFDIPTDLVAVLYDKSTHARRFVTAWSGTVAEPGWRGGLTLELTFNGLDPLTIPAGSGIAQVLFHRLSDPAQYDGAYQDQPDRPVEAVAW